MSRGARTAGTQLAGAQVIVMTGADAGLVYAVGEHELLIGRGAEAAVQLQEAGISRRHCRLFRDEHGSVMLEDLASPNGTYLNGTRLKPGLPVVLCGRDEIKLGRDARLVFRYQQLDDRDTKDLEERGPASDRSSPAR